MEGINRQWGKCNQDYKREKNAKNILGKDMSKSGEDKSQFAC
jgi:hypothetical protein